MKYFLTFFTILSFTAFGCNSDNANEVALNEDDTKTNVHFHLKSENELLIVTDLNEKKEFKSYYYIQSEQPFDLSNFKNHTYEIVNGNGYLSLKNKHGRIVFSINDENQTKFNSDNDLYISVYGISKRFTGDDRPLKINALRLGDTTCHSGGEGASECSTESGAPMSGNCSVSCRDGYYACCDDTRNECNCRKVIKKADE